MFIPSKSYKKIAPMRISTGASSFDVRDILVRCKWRHHRPTRLKMWYTNPDTLPMSEVIRVITWALLEKLSSSFSFFCVSKSDFPFSLASDEDGGAEETTSLRTRVFAYKTEFNWTLSRSWTVVDNIDQSCPVTVVINQYLHGRSFFKKRLSQVN